MAHVTTMVLKVDLQCYRCYKKVKDVLCRFDQIQDQVYDEKQNTVTINMICCDPEKMKHKIIRKGKGVIKCIEIKVPEKSSPKPDREEKTKEKPAKTEDEEKTKDKPAKTEDEEKKKAESNKQKEEGKAKEEPEEKPKEKPARPPPQMVPVPYVPCLPVCPVPAPAGTFRRTCCVECYEGRSGGPCFHGHNIGGPPPCYQYDGYWGRPVYDSYGGGYCSEPATCQIM